MQDVIDGLKIIQIVGFDKRHKKLRHYVTKEQKEDKAAASFYKRDCREFCFIGNDFSRFL